MKRTSLLLLITAALLAAMPLRAQQEKPKPENAPKSEAAHAAPRPVTWYRVDLAINEFEDGKKTNTRHYTMHVSDWGDESVMKLGTRVPVPRSAANGDFSYIDVGLNVRTRIIGRGDDHTMEMSFDLTSFAIPEQAKQTAQGQPILRQVQATNWMPVTTSKPVVVASLDDPNSTKRYEFEASLTKM
jgi:hypothetical protein